MKNIALFAEGFLQGFSQFRIRLDEQRPGN